MIFRCIFFNIESLCIYHLFEKIKTTTISYMNSLLNFELKSIENIHVLFFIGILQEEIWIALKIYI